MLLHLHVHSYHMNLITLVSWNQVTSAPLRKLFFLQSKCLGKWRGMAAATPVWSLPVFSTLLWWVFRWKSQGKQLFLGRFSENTCVFFNSIHVNNMPSSNRKECALSVTGCTSEEVFKCMWQTVILALKKKKKNLKDCVPCHQPPRDGFVWFRDHKIFHYYYKVDVF